MAEKSRSLKKAKLEQDANTPSLGLARCGRRAFQADVNPQLQHSSVSQQCGSEWGHGFRGFVVGCAAAASAQPLRWTDAQSKRYAWRVEPGVSEECDVELTREGQSCVFDMASRNGGIRPQRLSKAPEAQLWFLRSFPWMFLGHNFHSCH